MKERLCDTRLSVTLRLLFSLACASPTLTERPDAPSKASISRVEARTISVTWSPPYSGNSPLLYYLIEWKEVTDDWGIHSKSQRVPGTETRASISGLWPGTAYHVRLFAENSLGRSEPGPIMHAITELEAPSEPPSEVTADALGSKAIRVSWKPGYSLRMGSPKYLSQVKGYYVGFKVAHSASSVFNYKTVEVTSLTNNTSITSSNGHNGVNSPPPPGQYEAVIGNLEKLTKYVIIVKAFNRKGTGPPSDEIYVKTNDLGNECTLSIFVFYSIFPIQSSLSLSLSLFLFLPSAHLSFTFTFTSLKALHH